MIFREVTLSCLQFFSSHQNFINFIYQRSRTKMLLIFWLFVLFFSLLQGCILTPTKPLKKVTSIFSPDESREKLQNCLVNNPENISLCSIEKETYKTFLNRQKASLDITKSPDNLLKNLNHVLNWNTTWGKVSTGFSGRSVFGLYSDYDGILKGSIEDDGTLLGYWFQKTSHRRCGYSLDNTFYWGTFRFENFTRGRFYCNWAYCDSSPGSGGLWDGKLFIKED